MDVPYLQVRLNVILQKKVNTDAKKSENECIASDIILILPDRIPATIFNNIITALDVIESPAATFFCVLSSIITFIITCNILLDYFTTLCLKKYILLFK